MLYLFEGPDGSGKTTLANTIYNKHQSGCEYMHAGKPDSPGDYVRDWFLTVLRCQRNFRDWARSNNSNPPSPLVLDRARLISDLVYAAALKEQRFTLTPGETHRCVGFLRDINAIYPIVYIACCGISESLITREESDDPAYEDLILSHYTHIRSIYMHFHMHLAMHTSIKVLWYTPDLGTEGPDENINPWIIMNKRALGLQDLPE